MAGLIEGRIKRKPRPYDNPVELARAIDLYIQEVWDSKTVITKKNGDQTVTYDKPPSLAGLCIHLGLPSKMAYKALCLSTNRYVSQVAIAGLTWLESHYVESMQVYGANQSAFQFLLSNMGYKSENIFKVESVQDRSIPREISNESESAPSVRNIQINFVRSNDSLPDDVVKSQLLAEADDLQAIPVQTKEEPQMRIAQVE